MHLFAIKKVCTNLKLFFGGIKWIIYVYKEYFFLKADLSKLK